MLRRFGKILSAMKRLLLDYLKITGVTAINFGLLFAVISLLSYNSDRGVVRSGAADGGDAGLEWNLALLDERTFQGYHANLRHVLNSCGPPGGYIGKIDGDLNLMYRYQRADGADWVAYASLKNGFLTGVGYNESSINDHSKYMDWEFTDDDIPTYRGPMLHTEQAGTHDP